MSWSNSQVVISFCLLKLLDPDVSLHSREQSGVHVYSHDSRCDEVRTRATKSSKDMGELTNNDKRHISPINQLRLVLLRHQLRPHPPQLGTARDGPHKGQTAERETSELSWAGRGSVGGEVPDEIGCEGELDEAFDGEEAVEPVGVAGAGEERVAGEGDVGLADGDEEVEGGEGV